MKHAQSRTTSPTAAASWATALLCLGLLTGCRPKTNAYAPPPPPEVTVAHPVARPVTRYLEYTGTTEAFQAVELRARVAGFLEQVNFKPGSRVKKDDLLFVIDRRNYAAAVARAEAQLAANDAAATAAESDARIAEELASQRAGSEIDKITKIGKRDAAKAAVLATRAELDNARLDLEFCEVRAPLDGRITKNLVDPGNLVGSPGMPTLLATLVSTRPLYVTVDVSESDVLEVRRRRMQQDSKLEPGQIAPGEWRPVDLALADRADYGVHGHVDYVDPAFNAQTGTLRVRARFENEDDFLLPGMFVRVRFLMGTDDAVLAPDTALLTDQAGRFALVVDDAGVVQVRHVKIGALDGPLRVVVEGLSTTDRIVVSGLQRARPGAAVKATLRELPAAPPAASAPSASNPAGGAAATRR